MESSSQFKHLVVGPLASLHTSSCSPWATGSSTCYWPLRSCQLYPVRVLQFPPWVHWMINCSSTPAMSLGCIITADSLKACYGAIGRAGGCYTSLDPFLESIAQTRKVIKADWVLELASKSSRRVNISVAQVATHKNKCKENQTTTTTKMNVKANRVKVLGKDIGWSAPHGRLGSPAMKEFGER
jgi:hypothetical protein